MSAGTALPEAPERTVVICNDCSRDGVPARCVLLMVLRPPPDAKCDRCKRAAGDRRGVQLTVRDLPATPELPEEKSR